MIPIAHLRIESLSRRPPGGQYAGTPNPGVRVTYLPTNLSATCDYERSQMKNRRICELMIEYALAELGIDPAKVEWRP